MLVTKTLVGLMLLFSVSTTTPTVDPPAPINPCTVSTEKCIEKYFPEDPKLAIAVFKAESGLETHQVSYNCRYDYFNGHATSTHITSCKRGDEKKALSHDYGVAQINEMNYKGNKSELFDVETNMKVARTIYDKQHWNAWYAYVDGRHLKYLD